MLDMGREFFFLTVLDERSSLQLAGNAQPSLGSYTGQNYASLCRAFGYVSFCKTKKNVWSHPVVALLTVCLFLYRSRAGVNENVGTGFGTTNASNAVREEREVRCLCPNFWCFL